MLIGNLTRKPVTRETQSGKKLAIFTVAVNRAVRRADQKEFDEQVDFVPVLMWDRLADVAETYLDKGDKVYLEGYLKIERPNTQGWKLPATAAVVAKSLVMLGDGFRKAVSELPDKGEVEVEEGQTEEDDPDDLPWT